MKISIGYYPEEEAEMQEVVEVLKNLKPEARVKHEEPRENIRHAYVSTPRPGTKWGEYHNR